LKLVVHLNLPTAAITDYLGKEAQVDSWLATLERLTAEERAGSRRKVGISQISPSDFHHRSHQPQVRSRTVIQEKPRLPSFGQHKEPPTPLRRGRLVPPVDLVYLYYGPRRLSRGTETMENFSLAWVAGLLEGEGYFGLSHNASAHRYPRIQCNMTDLDVIRTLQAVTDVGKIYGPYKSPRNPHHKATYRWTVDGQDARHLMKTLLPLMGSRRQEQIRTALALTL
jgi:hypothetical protein